MAKKKGDLMPLIQKIFKEHSAQLFGSEDVNFNEYVLNQAFNAVFKGNFTDDEERNKAILATISMFAQLKPKNGLEGILATQMVATHEAAMECLRRAAISQQTFEGRNSALNHAAKLMRLYMDQMRTWNKQRGAGDQKMIIEHVNVAPGAQAIVGHVSTPALDKPQQRPMANELLISPDKAVEKPIKNATRKKPT